MFSTYLRLQKLLYDDQKRTKFITLSFMFSLDFSIQVSNFKFIFGNKFNYKVKNEKRKGGEEAHMKLWFRPHIWEGFAQVLCKIIEQ